MKAKKQTQPKLIATVTFKVFENEDGSMSTVLTKPEGLVGHAASYLLENHIFGLRAGTANVKASK